MEANIIQVCGLQVACKGNEAVGEIEFDFEDGPVAIPSCNDCIEYIKSLVDTGSAGVVD